MIEPGTYVSGVAYISGDFGVTFKITTVVNEDGNVVSRVKKAGASNMTESVRMKFGDSREVAVLAPGEITDLPNVTLTEKDNEVGVLSFDPPAFVWGKGRLRAQVIDSWFSRLWRAANPNRELLPDQRVNVIGHVQILIDRARVLKNVERKVFSRKAV